MTAQQLKNSILQMAVQGKLVPQDPTNEPASVLLERIRAEKERLIKEGKIKREKNPSVIFRGADNLPYEKVGDDVHSLEDELPFEIPDSWEWVRLGTVFQHNTGKALNASNRSGQLQKYITTSNLYWDRFELGTIKEMYFTNEEIAKCSVVKGDLLVCEGGDIGRAAIWTFNYSMCIQNHIHRLRAYIPVCTRFFYYLFDFYKHVGMIGGKGIGIQGLSSNAIDALLFPLPPLSEQERIVAKIEETIPVTAAYTTASERLDRLNSCFPGFLKKSILQMAVQGKLVPQDPADEPAEALLARIREQKEQLTREGKIKRDKHESIIYRRDNSHYEMVDGVERCIDDEIPFELPETWQWVRFFTIAMFENGDRSSKYPVESDYTTDGIPFFGAKDMGEKYMSFHDVRFISEEKFAILGNGKLQDMDMICLLRGSVGKTRIFRANKKYATGFICAQMLIIRCISTILLEYVYSVMSSPSYIQNIEARVTGTAVRQLPAKEVANMLIPIPPENEQRRIIATLNVVIPLYNAL